MKQEPPYDSPKEPKKTKFQLFAEQRAEAIKMGKSAVRTAKDIARNPRIAPNAVVEYRMSICGGCEYYDNTHNRCKKCGCLLRAKTKFLGAKCPIKKW